MSLSASVSQRAEVGALAATRWTGQNNRLAGRTQRILDESVVEVSIGHLIALRDRKVFRQWCRRRRLENRAKVWQRDPSERRRRVLLGRPVQGDILEDGDALRRAMRAQPRIDLVLEGLVALVAVRDLQSAEKLLTVLLTAEFGDEDRAPRVRNLGKVNLAPARQASISASGRRLVRRELADACRVQRPVRVKPLLEHRPGPFRLAGLLKQPIPGQRVCIRVWSELDLLEVM